MVAIPFPTSSAPGRFAESGGRLINAYAEKLVDGRIARRRVPGLRELLTIADFKHCRGGIFVNNTLLVALDERLFAITLSGGMYSAANLGSLPGTGPVFFARNNKTPTPDIVCIADSTAYSLTIGGAPSSYPDADVGSPNAVSFLKGYFIFTYGDGRMRASGLNSTAINTLDTAFAESKPDGLLCPVTIGNDLLAFGSQTTEVWRVDPNNVNGFPFSFLDTIPRGVVGGRAVAGFEDGWSNAIIFVGDDNVVYRLSGYTPQPISTPPVARMIEKLADRSLIECSVYMHEGHPIWCMSSPEWTWCFDLSTNEWHERKSQGLERWRGSATVKAFDQWIVGDLASGTFSAIDPEYFYEAGNPLTATIISSTATGFPNRSVVPRLELDIMSGVGLETDVEPIGTNPQVSISISRDGGASFGTPVLRPIGRQGRYRQAVRVNRLGLASAKGYQFRLNYSDPRPFTLFGGDLVNPEQRAS